MKEKQLEDTRNKQANLYAQRNKEQKEQKTRLKDGNKKTYNLEGIILVYTWDMCKFLTNLSYGIARKISM